MTGAAPGGAPAPGSAPGGAPGLGAATDVAPAAAARPPGRARRRIPWRTRFFALAGVAVVAGAAWLLLGNRVFVVRSVTVTGTRLVSTEQVIAAADVPLGTPLSRVDAGAVTRRVETIRQVSSATVTLDWPDHVAIAVTERVPVMAVRMANGELRPGRPRRGHRALGDRQARPAAAVHHAAVGRRAARRPRGRRRLGRARGAGAGAGARRSAASRSRRCRPGRAAARSPNRSK